MESVGSAVTNLWFGLKCKSDFIFHVLGPCDHSMKTAFEGLKVMWTTEPVQEGIIMKEFEHSFMIIDCLLTCLTVKLSQPTPKEYTDDDAAWALMKQGFIREAKQCAEFIEALPEVDERLHVFATILNMYHLVVHTAGSPQAVKPGALQKAYTTLETDELGQRLYVALCKVKTIGNAIKTDSDVLLIKRCHG